MNEQDYLTLSGVQHYAFCPRQWALIFIEQQWADNERTVDGSLMHRRAHDENQIERRGDTLTVRGLRVISHRLQVMGVCDVVEFHLDTRRDFPAGANGTVAAVSGGVQAWRTQSGRF